MKIKIIFNLVKVLYVCETKKGASILFLELI